MSIRYVQIPEDCQQRNFDRSLAFKPKTKIEPVAPGRGVEVKELDENNNPIEEPLMLRAVDHYGAIILWAATSSAKDKPEETFMFHSRAGALQNSLLKALESDRIWAIEDHLWEWLTLKLKRCPRDAMESINGAPFDQALLNASTEHPKPPEPEPKPEPELAKPKPEPEPKPET